MATLYYFKNLPKTGDVVEESKVTVHKGAGRDKAEIDYWVKFQNFGWIHLPIDDPNLDKKLENVNLDKNEYSYDEFIKLIN